MKFYHLSILGALLLAASCNQKNTDNNQDLQKKVVSVHDEVMPLMGGFVRNSIKIDSILNNLDRVLEDNPSADTAEVRVELMNLKGNLDNTVEEMNDWMYAFDMENEGQSKEEIKKYLENELLRIQKVKSHFEEAAKQSNIILKGY